MTNKALLSIAFVISAIAFIGLSVNVVIRNIPLGILSVVLASALNAIVITVLIAAISQKKKWLAITCRVLFVAWLPFAIYWGTYSANEDAGITSNFICYYRISNYVVWHYSQQGAWLEHNAQNKHLQRAR